MIATKPVLRVIADRRLRNQRITQVGPRQAANVVAWFGAMQAQEYGPAKWALALRMPNGTTDAAIERAIDQGRILRTHVLRPTWHFVTPADIRWMVELTAPHVHRAMSSYRRQLGLDTGVLTRAAAVLERALGDGQDLTRLELGEHLARAGLPGTGQPFGHLAMYAELEGVICSGPRRGKQSTYALLANRAPGARRLPREEALRELTRRFFRSHGPATIRDFVWWSGLKTADARRGLEMNGARPKEVGGLTYWTLGRDSAVGSTRNMVHLLPVYDEYLVAYRDREAVPHPAYSIANFWHALVVAGQIAGTWRTVRNGVGLVANVITLKRLTERERRALARAAERYGRFLHTPISLSVTRLYIPPA